MDTIDRELHRLVDGEDKAKPLSDTDLTGKLANAGFNVARRQVTKCRKKLGISSSRQRRDWSKN